MEGNNSSIPSFPVSFRCPTSDRRRSLPPGTSSMSVADWVSDLAELMQRDSAPVPLPPIPNSASHERRTRRPEEPCVVCGKLSSGSHYGALTCEGCKGFFRRIVVGDSKPLSPCRNNLQCLRNAYWSEKNCRWCRYVKCIQVGMQPECILPRCTSTSDASVQPESPDVNVVHSTTTTLSESIPTTGSATLSDQDKRIIRQLEELQEFYELPSEEQIQSVSVRLQERLENGGTSDEMCLETIAELARCAAELIVEFARCLPGFHEIQGDDKRTILQACSIELMTLRAARRYNYDHDCIVFANGSLYYRQNFVDAGIEYMTEPLFKFCRRMHTLHLDDAEYALLSAIIIFDRRPELKGADRIERMQEPYIQLLKNYTDYRCAQPGTQFDCTSAIRFGKLFLVVAEARELGYLNTNDCCALVWDEKVLPSGLIEAYGPSIGQCMMHYNEFIQLSLSDTCVVDINMQDVLPI